MSKRQQFLNSVLREEWDTATRLYSAWDALGVQTVQRPFTSAENAQADAIDASAGAEATETSLLTNLGGSSVFDNLRTIANGSGTFATAAIRDGAIRTCARAIVILIRLTLRRLDAVD